MDQTQGGQNEGGSSWQRMKHKEGNEGGSRQHNGTIDETKGGNEEGSRGQWMKHKGE